MDIKDQIKNVIARHLADAKRAEHDSEIATLAVTAARSTIMRTLRTSDINAKERVLRAVKILEKRYFDPEGEYTSGKPEIAALRHDIEAL